MQAMLHDQFHDNAKQRPLQEKGLPTIFLGLAGFNTLQQAERRPTVELSYYHKDPLANGMGDSFTVAHYLKVVYLLKSFKPL
jgi:hypothetical protein